MKPQDIITVDQFDEWAWENSLSTEEIGSGEAGETLLVARTDAHGLVASYMLQEGGVLRLLQYQEAEDTSSREELQKEAEIDAVNRWQFKPRNLFDGEGRAKPEKTTIYFACPTGKRRDQIVAEFGDEVFGACLTPSIYNQKTANAMRWFFDNGAFASHAKSEAFPASLFYKRLVDIYTKVRIGTLRAPDFIVIPDIVGGGERSLSFSMEWMKFLDSTKLSEFSYYLALQDGMRPEAVEELIRENRVDGLFLGGTKPWKYATGAKWCELARKYGLKIHAGGVGVVSKIAWAEACGFDSVDSGVAMIHAGHLNGVLDLRRDSNALGVAS